MATTLIAYPLSRVKARQTNALASRRGAHEAMEGLSRRLIQGLVASVESPDDGFEDLPGSLGTRRKGCQGGGSRVLLQRENVLP